MATALEGPYLEKMESQYSISTVDSVDDHSNIDAIVNKRWKYEEVLDLLKTQLAILPGSRDKNGHPVIVMHSMGDIHLFLVANVGRIISYLSQIPCEAVHGQGFTILLDMRQGTWSMMKKALEALSLTFVEHIHQVIVMKPKSLWQRGRTSMNFNLKKSRYKYKCVLLEHSADVFQYISNENVPKTQNGELEYDHSKWMQTQETIENFILELMSRKEEYDNLQESLDRYEEATNLEEARAAVKHHVSLFDKIEKSGLESFLSTIFQTVTQLRPVTTNPDFEAAFNNIDELSRSLQVQYMSVKEMWQRKGDALDHTLQFRVFESDAAMHIMWLQEQASYLSHELTKTGYDVRSSYTCKQQVEDYHKKINDKHHEINRVIEVGQRLLTLNHPSSELIAKQIDEVSANWEKLTDYVEERVAVMTLSVAFHEKEEKFLQQTESWMDGCTSMYIPPNIASTDKAIEEHKQLFELMSTMYSNARQDGHLLIEKLRRPVGESSVPVEFIQATRHIKEELESLYDEKNMIHEQWRIRQEHLRKTLNFQVFQKETKKIFSWISDVGNVFLVKNTSIGVDANSADSLLKSHDTFESNTETIYSQFNSLKSKAQSLSVSKECRQEELDGEVSKLEMVVTNFATRLDDRRDVLVSAIQCFKATDNFFKEAGSLIVTLPITRFEGTVSDLEGRLLRHRTHYSIISNIASTTLQLWNSVKKKFEVSIELGETANCPLNYSSSVRTVEENVKQIEKESARVKGISHSREKRWELSLNRHSFIADADDYLLQLESWMLEGQSELADNPTDAETEYNIFKRQYTQHMEKQDEMIEEGQAINSRILSLDGEMFNVHTPLENHNMIDAAIFNIKKAQANMRNGAGDRLRLLEECTQFHFLQQRGHKLTSTLNQLSQSLSQSVEACLKLEDVNTMEQNVKQIEESFMVVTQDVDLFSTSVSDCLKKDHYQSGLLNILNRTVKEKLHFVRDILSEKQRTVQSSIDFFSNYEKLQSTMEYCQVQFSSRETGQSLNDINTQQESLKELRESLMDTVSTVKSQAEQLKSVLGGTEQAVSHEGSSNDNAPRLLVAPKRIKSDKSSSVSPSPQHSQSIIDDLISKMDVRVSRLNRLWDIRLSRLEQSKQVIEFESEVPEVLKWLDEVGATFLHHRHEYGRSLEDVQQLLKEHDTFYHSIFMPMLQKMKDLRNKIAIFEESGHYELNRIRSIGNHLEQQWLKFDTEIQTRLSNLKLSQSFQENLFQGSNWCMQSDQFYQSLTQKINHCDKSDEASSLSAELSIYLSVTKSEQLDRVSKIQQISGFLHSNPLSELATNLDQNTQQILKDFEAIQHDLDILHAKLSHIEKEKDREMRLLKQKARVVEELIATEEVYVQDLKLVVETYKPRFVSDFLPESLKGKEAVVFGNIQWIAEFHTEVLWPQIQGANADADIIAQIFVNNVDVMTDLYVPYCQNKTNSEELLASHRSYLSRVSSLFGTDIPLSSLLIKPIQRITKYPLLLMDCLKYTQQLHQPTQALELAVQAVEEIPVQTNNAIHLSLLKSEEGLKWHKYGELLYQGSLLVSEPRLLITSEKERQIFLFENTVVFARRIDLGQAKFTYEYKFRIPLTAGVQVLEFIDGEPFKFAFFTSDHRMHLKASTLDIKQKWIKYLKLSIQKHVDEEENKLRSLSMSSARMRSNAVHTGDAVARDLTTKGQSSPYLPRRPSSPFSTTRINVPFSDANSSPPPVAFERYRVTEDYIPLKEDHHGLSLKKNQIIEVMEQLDTGRWFIQATSITGQIEHGWVPSTLLEAVLPEASPEPPSLDEPPLTRRRRFTDNFSSERDIASQQVISTLRKVTLGEGPLNNKPTNRKPVLVKMNVVEETQNEVTQVDSSNEQTFTHSEDGLSHQEESTRSEQKKKLKRKGVVRRRSSSRSNQSETSRSKESSSDEDEEYNNQFLSPVAPPPPPPSATVTAEDKVKKEKAEEKIRYIMAELYETEKEYVQKLDKLVNGFLNHIQQNSNLPDALQGKEWMIFGNVAAIYEFHNLVFQDMLEKAKDSLEAIAQCFLDKRSDFKMYVTYCENKPKSESFIWTYTHQGGTFFKEIQSKLGLREDIASFLIKPVQRITKYQLLLKDLLRTSQKAGKNVPLLEEALQLMQDVPKQANDAMALSMIVGYHGNIHANGQIVLQDEFTVYERARWAVGARRHVFLLDLMMIITKEKDNDGLYVFKDSLKVHNMTLTEKQADSPCRFAIGTGQIGDWDKYYILEASTSERKQEWIRTIKEILNQQFEMLKALKQPNARVRSGTVDTGVLIHGRESTSSKDTITTQPSVFHDMSDSSLDENSDEEEIDMPTTAVPVSPSIDQSAKTDTLSKSNLYIAGEDCPAPVQGQYIFNLKKGQIYDVVNSTGEWWLARIIQDVPGGSVSVGTEGWVPSTFMEPFTGELELPQIKINRDNNKTQPSHYATLPARINDSIPHSRSGGGRSSLFPGFSFKSETKKKIGKQKSKSNSVFPVPKFSATLSNESVICGHAVEFTCQLLEEYPDQKITWLHNNCPIGRSMAARSSGKVCSFKLANAVPEDEGLYTCKVTVQGQHASTSAKLTVLRFPDPPGQPKIKQITSTSLSLSWSAPSFDGHSPVTMYLMECKDVSGNRWSTLMNRISEPATIIEDLVPGTEYIFRVLAVNHIGCSQPSSESSLIKMSASTSNSYSLDPFEDHYTLIDQIASGKFSTVHECLHKATQQSYVAKLLPLSVGRSHAHHELEILAQIFHPNLVSMSSAFITDKHFIIVLQYIYGSPVYKYFIQRHSPTESDVATVCQQLGCALQYLHDLNIVHLSIKPHNILVIDLLSSCLVKLIHLSEAKFVQSREFKSSSDDRHIDFEAPEIILNEPVQTETDMWSMGVLLYTLLSGASPFIVDSIALTKHNIKQVMFSFTSDNFHGLSQDVRNLITSLLQRKPSNRIKTDQFLLHPWVKGCSSTRLLPNVQQLNNL